MENRAEQNMPLSAELGGIYPRSEQLIELTRSYDRGRTDRASLDKQFEHDTIELIKLQESSDFQILSDGAFNWQDQLRPIVESLDGITTGTRYDRWFDTNTFYKKPTINRRISVGPFEAEKFIRADLLPRSKAWKVTLIGPYTFSELSENLYYKNRPELVSDLAKAEHEVIGRLKTAGVSRFQISEPCLVYRPYREQPLEETELEAALNAIHKTVEGVQADLTVQTYFGDATSVLPRLLQLPVQTVGFDVFETDYSHLRIETPKRIALGILDSRESNVEDPNWIVETATRAAKHVHSEKVILVPNSDLKFVPRKVADSKTRALAEATRLAKETR